MDLYARLFGKTEVAASSDPIGQGLKEEPGISPSFLLIGRLVLKPRLNDRSGVNREIHVPLRKGDISLRYSTT